MGELYDKLAAYGESDYYPCHMPGHKRRLNGRMPEKIVKTDITEIDGFDNLHDARGILKELQEKASRMYGAEESFYLINGSTVGILSAISASVPFGGHILMGRNSHRSAYNAAYLRQLKISYFYPPKLKGFSFSDAVTPEQVRDALEKNPDIQAVFMVSPTYEGRIARVDEIAKIVHEKGLILIVDEAHGAHLGLAENFPVNSNQAGADLVIHSVHKTLPALTQSALLHVNGTRVDRDRLQRFLHIYQSSSPSYLLMAGIDNALCIVEAEGNRLFHQFYQSCQTMMTSLSECARLRFPPWEPDRQDIGKLVIDTSLAGISGQELYRILLDKYHIQPEMASQDYCLAMFTIGDTPEGYERMTRALLEIDKQLAQQGDFSREDPEKLCPGEIAEKDMLPLHCAWDGAWEYVPLQEAAGRYAAEFVVLYPPGVPVLVPGEKLTDELCRGIAVCLRQGLTVQGILSEQNGYQVRCIRLSAP